MKIIGLLLAVAAQSILAATNSSPVWPAADPAAVARWQDMRFGMFIHWGPVSLTGREIGWSRGKETPVEVYDNLYREFNPTNYNADEWVSVAKAAGMKYIVLTTKHHDGFCLWDTKQTDYNIMNSPFKRDVVKELAAACKRQGIGFGAYYSVMDNYNTNYPLPLAQHSKALKTEKEVVREHYDLDAYEKYLQRQITELIQNYGPLLTIWNDVPRNYDSQRGANTIKLLRQLQPDILINNRTGDGGDYDTPEQKIGKFQLDRPWESCMTVSAHNHWAWGGADDGVKSTAACLNMLIRGAGGNGNILLNVGPRPDGMIDPAQANLLKEVGAWLAKNGESIYGTRGGPWEPTASIASTRKGSNIFLHVLKSENGRVELPALPAEIKSATLLNGGKVEFSRQDGKLVITIPQSALEPVDTIVKLEVERPAMEIPAITMLASPGAQTNKASMTPVSEARVKQLQNLHWGIFVCWSLSSFSGKEWTPGVTNIDLFAAKGCDTDQWAKAAKSAGMGYILFLTKHHDGFCLWDTQTTDRKVTKAALGRDVLGELKTSCDKYGIKLALYFSEGEWRQSGGLNDPATPAPKKSNQGGKNAELKKAQLKELLTQYGPIEYIWFDHAVGDGGLSHAETLAFCKSLPPGCFIGFNHGDQAGADIRLGEMGRPGPLNDPAAAGPHMKDAPSRSYRLAEFTYPILPKHEGGANWFYSLPKHDQLCLPAEKIYADYLGAVKYGNIFSLDVGPDYAGKLRDIDVKTLRQVGEMIRNEQKAATPTKP